MTFARCNCCKRDHTHAQWDALELCGSGLQDDGVECLELRQCSCDSTLAIVLFCHTTDFARETLAAEEKRAA